MKKIAVTIAAVSLLAGCAGSSPMKPDVRARIHFVSIDKEVKAPLPTIYGSANTAGAILGGAVGALLASSDEKGKSDEKYLLSHHIDIKKIFRKDLIEEMNKRGPFKVVMAGKGDADISIEITNYGFWLGGKFMNFDAVRPTLYVRLTIKDKSGKEIWSGFDFVGNLSSVSEVVSVAEVRKNPEVAEKSLRQAAKMVAMLLVADIEGRKVPDSELAKIKAKNSELVSSAK